MSFTYDLDTGMIFDRDFDEYLEKAKAAYHSLEVNKKRLSKELAEYNKDEEIAKRDKKIEAMRAHALEIFTDSEMVADKAFRTDHYERCGNGSSFQYTLTGTGLGTVIEIKCPKCGESKDITDDKKF